MHRSTTFDIRAGSRASRGGMTLVELLVVVSILGLLSVTVLPAFSSGESARASRRAAAAVSSLVAQSQAASLGQSSAAGLWIEPLSGVAAIDLSIARRPEPYRGDTFTAAVSLTQPSNPSDPVPLTFSRGGADVALMTTMKTPAFSAGTPARPLVSNGDLIQIGHGADLFALECDPQPTANGFKARLRLEAGQTPANTVWPTPSIAGGATTWHSFKIHRKPAPAGSLQSIANGMAIDLAWSGIGPERFGPTPLAGDDDYPPAAGYNAGQSIAMMFDSAGSVTEAYFLATPLSGAAVDSRVTVRGTVLLLVGRLDRCGLPYNPAPTEANPGANWQYADSTWIAIDPRSGLARAVPPALHIHDAPVTNARDSQVFVRSGP